MASRIFHEYEVIAKDVQSEVITSFSLRRSDGEPVASYRPGQYLVFRLQTRDAMLLRNYSVSGDPADASVLRIAVKREPPPPGSGWPAGAGSGHLHDLVQVGDRLSAAGPLGEFVLDESSERPVVLFSGGVGLTPMLCMLHRLVAAGTRPVFFIHACENGRMHAFEHEVRGLAARRPGVITHFCYRTPSAQDLEQRRCDSQGLVSRQTLQELLPLDDYDVYLCGPTGFMQANWAMLRGLGIARNRIHYEFFGPATVLESQEEDALAQAEPAETARIGTDAAAHAPMQYPPSEGGKGAVADAGTEVGPDRVRFLPSGTELAWDDSCESLLALAEKAGLQPEFNCRAGLCNTCMSRLVTGQVQYIEPPLDEPGPGQVLICCARPVGAVEIELAS